ncbi:MAG TPA: site-specific integrase [Nitrososphaeraceae archaeon]|nr:site-specific integrase [Nitrososphaeraceae archaeon]
MISQQQNQQQEAYSNFIDSINSDMTRKDYKAKFDYFMQFCNVQRYEDMLLISEGDLESRIRNYIIYLRHDKRLAPGTVSGYIAPIIHFYDMNGFTLHWKRLKKFQAKHYNIVEDKPYTREQIKTLVDAAQLRDKCMILLMCSAGLRRGALSYLRIRDLQKIDKYQLYRINVYKKEREQYTTFCTPECAKYIDQYLDWRKRISEQLKPNSPLFRIEFDTATEYNRPKAVSSHVVAFMIHTLLDRTGVRARTDNRTQRTELMQTHGFRKFFKTTCINSGMNPLYSEYLMGHRSGLTKSYFKPTDTELLEGNEKALGYIAAINDLTINEEHRLTKKVNELQVKNDQIMELERQHKKDLETVQNQVAQMMQMIRQEPRLTKIKPQVLLNKRASQII